MMAVPFFGDEEQMRDLLIKWLGDNGFIARRRLHIKSFEIDVAAIAPAVITKEGVRSARERYVYAFEAKIATSYKLTKDVVEQATIRLLAADYVYIVVPRKAEIWEDGETKKTIEPPAIVNKRASGVYSKSIGIIAMEPNGTVEVVRTARKSGLTIKELRDLVLKELSKEGRVRPLY